MRGEGYFFYHGLNPLEPIGEFEIISISGIVYANKINATKITPHTLKFSKIAGVFSAPGATSATGNSSSPFGAKKAKLNDNIRNNNDCNE